MENMQITVLTWNSPPDTFQQCRRMQAIENKFNSFLQSMSFHRRFSSIVSRGLECRQLRIVRRYIDSRSPLTRFYSLVLSWFFAPRTNEEIDPPKNLVFPIERLSFVSFPLILRAKTHLRHADLLQYNKKNILTLIARKPWKKSSSFKWKKP